MYIVHAVNTVHAVLHHVLHIQKVVANQTDKGYNFTNTVENYAYT